MPAIGGCSAAASRSALTAEAKGPTAADVAAARALLAEKRQELPGASAEGTSGPSAPVVSAEVGKFAGAVLFPNPDVVGRPLRVAFSAARVSEEPDVPDADQHVPAMLKATWREPGFTYSAHVATAPLDYSVTGSGSTWEYVPWAAELQEKKNLADLYSSFTEEIWAKVTVRGNPGFALAEWDLMSKEVYGGTSVVWVEDGVRYELHSGRLYADQLLAIADTMVKVKP